MAIANPAARKWRAFCGTCYSAPHFDGSMSAAGRWATSHMSTYPGHDVGMYEIKRNPTLLSRPTVCWCNGRCCGAHPNSPCSCHCGGVNHNPGAWPHTCTAARNPRRDRPRRRNPGRGEWIDLAVPAVLLFLLIRSGRLQLGGGF